MYILSLSCIWGVIKAAFKRRGSRLFQTPHLRKIKKHTTHCNIEHNFLAVENFLQSYLTKSRTRRIRRVTSGWQAHGCFWVWLYAECSVDVWFDKFARLQWRSLLRPKVIEVCRVWSPTEAIQWPQKCFLWKSWCQQLSFEQSRVTNTWGKRPGRKYG